MAGDDRDLESRIDELYALPLEAFVEARTSLARDRKAAGDRDGAAEVASLRKPTVPAWTLNQLARQDRPGVDGLVEAGEELARAQRKAMAGGRRADLQEAGARRRQAVEQLVERAREILTGAGHTAAAADRVTDTLMAMATDPGLTEAVRRGRLEREAPPPAGFGAIPGLEAGAEEAGGPKRGGARARTGRGRQATDEVGARRTAREDRERRAGAREADAARERVQALEAAAAEAEEEAGQLEGEAEDRERQAGKAREEAERLQRAARAARDLAEEAEREARLARRRADRSRTEAGRARSEADRARQRLAPS